MPIALRRPPIRLFAIAVLPLAFPGCVLLPPLDVNQTFRLSTGEPVAPIVQVIDDRSPRERDARSRSDGWQVGEASMTPDVASYVAQEMTRVVQASPDRARLEALLAGRTVHLRLFDAGAEKSQRSILGSRPVPGESTPLAATTYELDMGATLLNAVTTVHVAIAIDVDAVPYSGSYIAGRHVQPFENLLVEPAHEAVVEIVAQIDKAGAVVPATP